VEICASNNILTITSNVTVRNPDIDISAVIDNVGDAFGTKEKKEYLGHVTLLR
jgi:hypothetical protein